MTVTQRLRQEGPIARDIKFKVRPGPRYRVCFRTPRDDTVRVALVNQAREPVRVLHDAPLAESGPAEQPGEKPPAHCFDWDGRNDAGDAVPPGFYRLQVTLLDADRQGVSGEKLRITEPPS